MGFKHAITAAVLLLGATAQASEWEALGRQQMAEGDTQGAIQSFTEATRVNPFDAIALHNLAVAKADMGNYQQALLLLERAYRLAPHSADIQTNLVALRGWLEDDGGYSGYTGLTYQRFQATAQDTLPEPPPLWQNTGYGAQYPGHPNTVANPYLTTPPVLERLQPLPLR